MTIPYKVTKIPGEKTYIVELTKDQMKTLCPLKGEKYFDEMKKNQENPEKYEALEKEFLKCAKK
jgi:hypothetical protein